MECRPLDITVLAAKGLKDVNLLSKMDVYAVVNLSGADPRHTPPQKTPVDKDAGTSPQWNFPIKFTLDESAVQMNRLTLVFTVMSDRTLGDKVVGEVRVPVKELLDDRSEKTVSYAVHTPKGKTKGSLDFSYRFGDKYTYAVPAQPPPPHAAIPASVKGSDEPVTAYPATAAAAGSSSSYAAYPPQGYAQPGYGYPPPQYPPPATYGYPPQYPPAAYGYPQAVQKPPKKSGGSKLGLGLAGGLLGGLLIGDMISDVGDGGFDGGFGGGFDDGGFGF